MSSDGTARVFAEQKVVVNDPLKSSAPRIQAEHVAMLRAALRDIKNNTQDEAFCVTDHLSFYLNSKWKQVGHGDDIAVWYGSGDCYDNDIEEGCLSVHRGTTWTTVRKNTGVDHYHTCIFLTHNEDDSIPTAFEKDEQDTTASDED